MTLRQLKMHYPKLTPPNCSMSEDVFVTCFQEGDEESWLSIVKEGLFPADMTKEDARKDFLLFPYFNPLKDTLFAERNGKKMPL